MASEYLTIAYVHTLGDQPPADGGQDGPPETGEGERRRRHLRSTVGRGLMGLGARLAGEDPAGSSELEPIMALKGGSSPGR